MPICGVCGEDEYYEEDGHFFCTICNTQSQSMVVMEVEEIPGFSFGVLQEIQQEKKKKERKSEFEAGRPWTRYEAYQLILQAQANALIGLGAHQSVKDAITRLYFAYLSKLGVAFVGEDRAQLIPKGLARSSHRMWHRELWRGGMDKPDIVPRAMIRKLHQHDFFNSVKQAEKAQARENLAASLAGETFYEGDNPLGDEGEQDNERDYADSEDLSLSDLEFSEEEENDMLDDTDGEDLGMLSADAIHSTPKPKRKKMGKFTALRSIQFLNLRRTLSFCYLGCIFTSPSITVSDIIKWVYTAALPYLETTHLLKQSMKLSAFDHHLFRPVRCGPVPFNAIRNE